MIKLKNILEGKQLMSEAMRWHYDHKINITENIFRTQSQASLDLIVEARKMFNSGHVWFEGRDKELFETTDIGRFGIFEGKRVPLDHPMEIPLDFPMINESETEDILKNYSALIGYVIRLSDKGGENKSVEQSAALSELRIYYENLRDGKNPKPLSRMANVSKKFIEGEIVKLNDSQISQLEKNGEGVKTKYSYNTTAFVNLDEAEYQGKKVKLGEPTKGGRKKYQVYVRNNKGNVIKISYGDSGMKANWNDPGARKSFAARHRCHMKKDRTKAGYWACRAHKDFGRNVSGRFW